VAEFIEAASLLFVLLNPFALSVYLVDVIHQNHWSVVLRVLLRASVISFLVFAVFALAGELVFTRGLNVRFAAFQIFGGLVFLLVGIRLMLGGAKAIETLRGPAEHLAGAIAMPFMIGPGTVSAAVLVGSRLETSLALLAIAAALTLASLCLVGIKLLLDRVREINSRLIERYVDVAGRIAALTAGTVAVEMILQGFDSWLSR
jgi:small neutral amino acid transporter SnatA (MarC family)